MTVCLPTRVPGRSTTRSAIMAGIEKINRKLQTPFYKQRILASSLDDNPARANAVGCEELRSRSEDNIVPNFEKFGV